MRKHYDSLTKKLGLCIGIVLIMVSCNDDDHTPVATGTRLELTLDSVFLYARQTYLWYDALPDYNTFAPRQYSGRSTDKASAEAALFAVTQYAVNPATGKSYEYLSATAGYPKYSFIQNKVNSSATLGTVTPEGTGRDFGFAVTATGTGKLYIRYVTTGSPAAAAGLVRGDLVLQMNGVEAATLLQNELLITQAFNESSMTLSIQKEDSTIADITLEQKQYIANPVLKSTVLHTVNGNTGYLALSLFTRMSNAQSKLDEVFAGFAAAGITNLVVDLRYNGGGYVETAEYLANLIAPATLNNAMMYAERYNDLLQRGKASILSRQPLYDSNGNRIPYKGRYATYADVDFSEEANTYSFSKKGSLQTVNHVYFITTNATASASEMLIAVLQPYMDVTVIGSTSYGKPVGFFGISIDQYTVYMSNFQIINAAGESNYFQGLTPDVAAPDDVTHDFGDPEEACLAQVITAVDGRISNTVAGTQSSNANYPAVSGEFTGMLEARMLLH